MRGLMSPKYMGIDIPMKSSTSFLSTNSLRISQSYRYKSICVIGFRESLPSISAAILASLILLKKFLPIVITVWRPD